MADLLDARIAAYLDSLLPVRDPLLLELEERAAMDRIPISGPHVCTLLALLVRLARPHRVLEVGAAIGYAAIWMGRALREYAGQLQTIEIDPERVEDARASLSRAELSDVVDVLAGPALEVMATLKGTRYGLIFLDAVKAEYPAYFEHAVPMLPDGGLLVADNALLGGEVARGYPGSHWDEADREGMRAYTAMVFGHPALTSVLLPLRDGLILSLKR